MLIPLALAAQSHSWWIVPGQGVGPIARDSTLVSLQREFGTANVREQTISGAEGEEHRGVIVYPDSPARRLAVTWAEGEAAGHPSEISICYRQDAGGPCEWKTKEGITLGTTLQHLERLNGRLFRIAGFGWDYSGAVLSWNGGRLESLRAGGLHLELNPDESTLAQPEGRKNYRQVQGDRSFSSGHPAMQALHPRVTTIHFLFVR